MISEYVLLLVLSVFLLTGAVAGMTTTLRSGLPKLSARLEKHLITGHVFALKSQNDPKRVVWAE